MPVSVTISTSAAKTFASGVTISSFKVAAILFHASRLTHKPRHVDA
jgi:hypothetical protein